MITTVRYIGFTFKKQADNTWVEVGLWQESPTVFYITLARTKHKDIVGSAESLGAPIDRNKIKQFVDKKVSNITLTQIKAKLRDSFSSVWHFYSKTNYEIPN